MLHDDTALVSDLSWMSFIYQLDGDDAMAEYWERRAQDMPNQHQTGQDWDASVDRRDGPF